MDVMKFPVNLKTPRGFSKLLHGGISLPEVTSYDKIDCHGFGSFNILIDDFPFSRDTLDSIF